VQLGEQVEHREVGGPPGQWPAHHLFKVAHGLLARMNAVHGERRAGGDGANIVG
jgi:hypothetical protein